MNARTLLAVVSKKSDDEETILAARLAQAEKSHAVTTDALAAVRAERDARLRAGEDTEQERGTIASLAAEEASLAEERRVAELLHAEAVVRARKDREEKRRDDLRAEVETILPRLRALRDSKILPALDALAVAVEEDERHTGRLRLLADALPGEAVPRPQSVDEISGPVALSFRVRELAADLRRFRV